MLTHIKRELRKLVRREEKGGGDGYVGRGPQPAALRAFQLLDRSGGGHLTRRDFRRALEGLGFIGMGQEEAAGILDHFDPRR